MSNTETLYSTAMVVPGPETAMIPKSPSNSKPRASSSGTSPAISPAGKPSKAAKPSKPKTTTMYETAMAHPGLERGMMPRTPSHPKRRETTAKAIKPAKPNNADLYATGFVSPGLETGMMPRSPKQPKRVKEAPAKVVDDDSSVWTGSSTSTSRTAKYLGKVLGKRS